MIDVIGARCSQFDIPSIGLLARVPHYVGAMPFPAASVALLEGLALISGLSVDTESLRRTAETGMKQVDDLIAQSAEHQEMVHQLEAQYGSEEGAPIVSDSDIPSGEEIAAELERYLRGDLQ
jgi:predicted ATP-grasp superfamily ATP-dependent carboligase